MISVLCANPSSAESSHDQFISIQLFIRSFVPSFLPSFIPSFFPSFIHSFIHSFISASIHTSTHSFLPSFYAFIGNPALHQRLQVWSLRDAKWRKTEDAEGYSCFFPRVPDIDNESTLY